MEATDAVAVDAADDYAVDTAADVAAAEAAADAAEAAADAAVAVDDPAYDRSNWSADDRKRVEDLELAYENASLAAQQAAEEAAENARKKLPPTEIGRASCRERVGQTVENSVGAGPPKKKTKQ